MCIVQVNLWQYGPKKNKTSISNLTVCCTHLQWETQLFLTHVTLFRCFCVLNCCNTFFKMVLGGVQDKHGNHHFLLVTKCQPCYTLLTHSFKLAFILMIKVDSGQQNPSSTAVKASKRNVNLMTRNYLVQSSKLLTFYAYTMIKQLASTPPHSGAWCTCKLLQIRSGVA